MIKSIMERCSCSDKGERAGAGERAEDALHTHKHTHTHIHFIIIYISSAWQGEGKISKNVTNKQTHIHFIIIYISAAWQEKTK